MNDSRAVERLFALELDLDLEVSLEGQTFQLRGQGKNYELTFPSWINFFAY